MNQKDLKLIQYCEIDGIRNFPDSYIAYLFEIMKSEKLIDKVFYDGQTRTGEDFLNIMKYGQNKLFVIFYDKEVSGIVWLNGFQRRSANIHFCLFKNVWGRKSIIVGKGVLNEILYLKDDQGYIFDVIIGMTPSNNEIAVKWIQKVGMTVMGEIPSAICENNLKKSIPGIISYIERKREG